MMRSWLARRERTPKGRIFTDTARFYAVLSLHSIRVYQGLLIERPGIQSESKVMQAHADLHDYITRGVLP